MAGVLPNAPTALYEDIKIGHANYIGVPDFVFVELICLFSLLPTGSSLGLSVQTLRRRV